MTEEEILRQEEMDRMKKQEWWHRHPLLYFIHRKLNRWGSLPPDE